MKKTISILLALVLCLSLCACNSGKEAPVSEPEKHEATTVPMETELEIIETEAIVETEPQFVTVELTLDNWQEYYELVETPNFQKNAFGEVEGFGVSVELRMKEEYQQLLVSIENGAIEYQRQYAVVGCQVDMEAETYQLLDVYTIREDIFTGMDNLSRSHSVGGGTYLEEGPTNEAFIPVFAEQYGASGPYDQSLHGYPVNIEVTRIQGTLTFTN